MENNPKKGEEKLAEHAEKELRDGWISSSYGELCKVWHSDQEYTCRLVGRLRDRDKIRGLNKQTLVVGDRVKFEVWEGKKGLVRELLPRKSELHRRVGKVKHGGHHGRVESQLLAANIERVLIVAAATSPIFSTRLVDRLWLAARHANLQTLLCVTKLDLTPQGIFDELANPYRRLGLQVLRAVITQEEGVPELARLLQGGCTILVGPSGAGKTSLSNALCGVRRRVGEVGSGGRGRHTTSASQLLPLREGGGFLIDSPGMREFIHQDIKAADLRLCYPGICEFAGQCSFQDCWHRGEPNCAVREATEKGDLENWRLKHYWELLEELS